MADKKKLFLILIILVTTICIKSDEVETKEEIKENVDYEVKPDSDTITATSIFSTEWETKMWDYEPDYVYMIPIDYKKREVFYDNITHVPARIRGAFLTDDEKNDHIDFEIRGPKGDIKFRNSSNACIFDFNTTDIGKYTITFHNLYVNTNLKTTFTLSTGQNVVLKKDDLSFSEQKLNNLLMFVNKLNLEMKMTRRVNSDRYKKIKHTNKYFYTFSVIETLVLIAISIWQFYYMRQLFEVKGSF